MIAKSFSSRSPEIARDGLGFRVVGASPLAMTPPGKALTHGSCHIWTGPATMTQVERWYSSCHDVQLISVTSKLDHATLTTTLPFGDSFSTYSSAADA